MVESELTAETLKLSSIRNVKARRFKNSLIATVVAYWCWWRRSLPSAAAPSDEFACRSGSARSGAEGGDRAAGRDCRNSGDHRGLADRHAAGVRRHRAQRTEAVSPTPPSASRFPTGTRSWRPPWRKPSRTRGCLAQPLPVSLTATTCTASRFSMRMLVTSPMSRSRRPKSRSARRISSRAATARSPSCR